MALSLAQVVVIALASPVPCESPHARISAAFTDAPLRAEAGEAPDRSLRTIADGCAVSYAFLPYWTSTATMDWAALSHVAAFSVELSASGGIANARGWPWTNTVALAHAQGVRVHLTITNFSPAQILGILTNPSTRSTAIETIAQQVALGQADGACIDFEGSVANGWPALMPAFIADLRSRLRADDPDAEVAVAAPAVNWGSWNFAEVAQAADIVFIMGYDYAGSWSTQTGPGAPLTGGSLNVRNTVINEYASARSFAAGKLVLGMPLYGNSWQASGPDKGAPVVAFNGSVTYASAEPQAQTIGRQWDFASSTPWFRHPSDSGFRQVWYEDAQSLQAKINLARTYGLAGAGLWAAGYEGTDGTIWALMRTQLRDACPCSPADLTTTGTSNGTPDGVVNGSDFTYYLSLFASSAPAADLTTTGTTNGIPDGVINGSDFTFFLGLFAAGCP